jgi:23S rRNA (pseudouridine1915-N3)-methyltransferase
LRIRILAIGRCRDAAIRELTARYLTRAAMATELVELQPRGSETQAILAGLPAEGRIVALDERGRDLGSADIAAMLRQWRDEGQRLVTFVIGGADGLDTAVLARAELCLAFGRATWPHMLVRVMLAEQLYRAGTILSGHPYHRA